MALRAAASPPTKSESRGLRTNQSCRTQLRSTGARRNVRQRRRLQLRTTARRA